MRPIDLAVLQGQKPHSRSLTTESATVLLEHVAHDSLTGRTRTAEVVALVVALSAFLTRVMVRQVLNEPIEQLAHVLRGNLFLAGLVIESRLVGVTLDSLTGSGLREHTLEVRQKGLRCSDQCLQRIATLKGLRISLQPYFGELSLL